MKHSDIVEGNLYLAVVRGKSTVVQILCRIPYRLGWIARNMATSRNLYIRSPKRLRLLKKLL